MWIPHLFGGANMGKNLYYCKIDGTIYNFKEVQELLQQNKQWDAIEKISDIVGCDHGIAGNIFMTIYNNNMEIPVFIDSSVQPKSQSQQKNIPKCPTCSSTNIRKISTTRKVVGAIGFGLLSKTAKSHLNAKIMDINGECYAKKEINKIKKSKIK